MINKLNRKRKTKDPCQNCGLHKTRCLCDSMPTLSLKTKVVLIVHYKELKRTTNSGKLAIQALENSEMRIRGERTGEALSLKDLLTPNYRTMLFYPSEDAIELTEQIVAESSLPIQLLVPDGNWRQASKVFLRHPELKNVMKVKMSVPNLSSQHLRKEHFAEGMSTLEAIAKALEIIEGPTVGKKLADLYQLKLERTLLGRHGQCSAPVSS
jgi:DTW domain-containing protein YfiP